MQTEMPFHPGDVVQLKSGGAKMTVERSEWSVRESLWVIFTTWLHTDGAIERSSFSENELCKP
jgi:uncharacterized protein YodC (DUF2158 family)